jgi:hypothetical protein
MKLCMTVLYILYYILALRMILRAESRNRSFTGQEMRSFPLAGSCDCMTAVK